MPVGHIYLYVLFYVPPTGSAFAAPNDSVAESNAYLPDQVANFSLQFRPAIELVFYVLGGFNMPGYDWEPMNGTNCRESEFVE